MKPIRSTEVFTTAACFRQRVNLPAAQVAGLTDEELASALCFEIEPFSGIARSDGQLAWKRAEGGDVTRAVFDVVQIRTRDLQDEVAKQRAAKRSVRAVTAVPDAATGETVERLPWIPLKAAGTGASRLVWLVGIAGALVVLALGGEYWRLSRNVRNLSREVAAQRVLQAERNQLTAKLTALQREADAIRAARMESARAQQNADVLRAAWRVLLEAVPKACRDESVLKTMTATGAYSAELTGLALSPEAATRTFVRLTEELKPPKSGWRLTPGAIQAPAAGGTVRFECRLAFDPEGQFK